MRLFEILLLFSLFLSLIGYFYPNRKRPRFFVYLPFLAVVFILIHLLVEKYRWQMVPAYVWCLLFVCLSLFQLRKTARDDDEKTSRGLRVFAVVLTVLLVILFLLTAAIPWFFPVVHFPKPTGAYAVGTTTMHLIDSSRPEAFTDDPDDHREFMVRIWYPAEPAKGAKPIPYWEKASIVGPVRIKDDFQRWGLTFIPSYFFNHFSLMKTNSYPDAPLAKAKPSYPVVLFSPGGGVIHERNFLHVEELASHGYIVFSLSAPFDSWVVIFPDDRMVRGKFLKANPNQSEEEKEKERKGQELTERLNKTTDIQERKALMREIFAFDPDQIMDKLLGARVADARFAFDELIRMNSGEKESPFRGKLDLNRVGIFGMSLGGAVTGQVCLEDDRFKAGVNLDGTQFGTLIDNYLHQPFMFMNSGESGEHNDFVYDRVTNFTYSVTVKGSSHMDFTDMFFTTPIVKKLNRKAIPDNRMYRVTNAYILAFFDKYLRGVGSQLLEKPSEDYPEAVFKVVNTPEEVTPE
jgi:predicted dienelactone hydrolase